MNASIGRDPELIRYVEDPSTDMHTDTACKVFLLKKKQVCENTTRDAAKNLFVFRGFYGGTYFQAAPSIWKAMQRRDFRVEQDGIPIREHLASKGITELGECNPQSFPRAGTFEQVCKKTEDWFWKEKFKVHNGWRKRTWEDYQRTGGFWIPTGFRVNGIHKRNDIISYPPQGSAFHCLLQVLIWMHKWLKKYKMKTLIVGEVHDSGVLDIHLKELEDVIAKYQELVTVKLRKKWPWIIVPLAVSFEVSPPGESWYAKTPVKPALSPSGTSKLEYQPSAEGRGKWQWS